MNVGMRARSPSTFPGCRLVSFTLCVRDPTSDPDTSATFETRIFVQSWNFFVKFSGQVGFELCFPENLFSNPSEEFQKSTEIPSMVLRFFFFFLFLCTAGLICFMHRALSVAFLFSLFLVRPSLFHCCFCCSCFVTAMPTTVSHWFSKDCHAFFRDLPSSFSQSLP